MNPFRKPCTRAGDSGCISPPARKRSPLPGAVTALASCLLLASAPGDATAVSVSLTTGSLTGSPAALEFALFDGDGTPGNNSVSITAFSSDGALGAAVCGPGCTGGPPFVIDDTFGLGQLLQYLTLGTRVSFDLTFTTHFGGSTADRLVISLLDENASFTLVNTNLDFLNDAVPGQDALLVVDLAPGAPIRIATVNTPPVTVAVPEPAAGTLLPLGLALLAGQRIRRRRDCVAEPEQTSGGIAPSRLFSPSIPGEHP
mgnify:CR=1 FL=1